MNRARRPNKPWQRADRRTGVPHGGGRIFHGLARHLAVFGAAGGARSLLCRTNCCRGNRGLCFVGGSGGRGGLKTRRHRVSIIAGTLEIGNVELCSTGRAMAPVPTWFAVIASLYCSIWRKIHGLDGAMRPIITASQPVWVTMAQASSGERMSPLPITGIFTASFTAAIHSHRALPL